MILTLCRECQCTCNTLIMSKLTDRLWNIYWFRTPSNIQDVTFCLPIVSKDDLKSLTLTKVVNCPVAFWRILFFRKILYKLSSKHLRQRLKADFEGGYLNGEWLVLGNQRFPLRVVRLLSICRGELSTIIARVMSKCVWSGWKW